MSRLVPLVLVFAACASTPVRRPPPVATPAIDGALSDAAAFTDGAVALEGDMLVFVTPSGERLAFGPLPPADDACAKLPGAASPDLKEGAWAWRVAAQDGVERVLVLEDDARVLERGEGACWRARPLVPPHLPARKMQVSGLVTALTVALDPVGVHAELEFDAAAPQELRVDGAVLGLDGVPFDREEFWVEAVEPEPGDDGEAKPSQREVVVSAWPATGKPQGLDIAIKERAYSDPSQQGGAVLQERTIVWQLDARADGWQTRAIDVLCEHEQSGDGAAQRLDGRYASRHLRTAAPAIVQAESVSRSDGSSAMFGAGTQTTQASSWRVLRADGSVAMWLSPDVGAVQVIDTERYGGFATSAPAKVVEAAGCTFTLRDQPVSDALREAELEVACGGARTTLPLIDDVMSRDETTVALALEVEPRGVALLVRVAALYDTRWQEGEDTDGDGVPEEMDRADGHEKDLVLLVSPRTGRIRTLLDNVDTTSF